MSVVFSIVLLLWSEITCILTAFYEGGGDDENTFTAVHSFH